MRSEQIKTGVERTPNRSLLYALGYTDEELARPLIGVVSSYNEIVPGHMGLDKIAEAVKAGIRAAGGTPVMFPAIAVCDGIAMGHVGMKYSLVTRDLIAGRLPAVSVMTRLRPAPLRPFLRRRGGLDQALGGGRGGAEGLLQRRALLPPQLVLEPLDLLDEPVDGLLLLQTPLAVARIRGRGHASSHGSRPRLRSTASRPSRTRAASSARPFSMACLSSGTNSGRTCMHRSFPPSRYV